MNFLAHIYLSGEDPEIMLGNFMADQIKGNAYENFPEKIKRGILLHRAIDTFSDTHPDFLASRRRLREKFGIYSGVITDLIYDHFLAKYWSQFSESDLQIFSNWFYRLLLQHQDLLPPGIAYMLPYMQAQNWLLSYAESEGLRRALAGIGRRIKSKVDLSEAVDFLYDHYEAFENDFFAFFPACVAYSERKLESLEKM